MQHDYPVEKMPRDQIQRGPFQLWVLFVVLRFAGGHGEVISNTESATQ